MDLKLFRTIFKESKEKKKVIGIRLYEDEDDFWCGYILDFNDQLIQIQNLTKLGKPDGIIIERIENIESLDFKDSYCESYQYLIQNNTKINTINSKVKLPNKDNWQYDILNRYLNKKTIVSIAFKNEILIAGFIENLDKKNVTLIGIGNLGENEGYSCYRVDDIKSIKIGDEEDAKRKLLYDWRQKKNKQK